MDWMNWKTSAADFLKKYRYVLILVLCGMFFLLLPDAETEKTPEQSDPVQAAQEDLQESLETILSQISGAGKVKVLLTLEKGEQTIYQTDEDLSSGTDSENTRRDTVLISDVNREENGLVRQTIPPVYRGAIIVCQGGNDAKVRLSIVEAVMSVTGLRSDCITVLKMK